MISVTAVAASVAAVVLTAALVIPRELTDVAPPALPGSTYSVAVEGGDFRTIGEAVAAAQDGDTVLVEPGTYDEALVQVIEKDITIEGTGAAPRQTVIAVPPGARETLEDVLPLHESVAGLEAPARPSVGLQLLDSEAVLRNLQIMGQDDGVAVIVRGGAPAFEDVVRHAGERDANRVLAGSLFIDGASAPTISGGQMWHRVQIDDDSTVTFVEALLQYGKVVVQGGSSLVFTGGTVFASDIQPITIVDGASATIRGPSSSAAESMSSVASGAEPRQPSRAARSQMQVATPCGSPAEPAPRSRRAPSAEIRTPSPSRAPMPRFGAMSSWTTTPRSASRTPRASSAAIASRAASSASRSKVAASPWS